MVMGIKGQGLEFIGRQELSEEDEQKYTKSHGSLCPHLYFMLSFDVSQADCCFEPAQEIICQSGLYG